ncbi:hypothetical protein [Streptomyces sp. NPDC051214]|uniref:hypothetical protein n=1 Tax=Streptomyces sp. NPDC051214 TaxID=3155282 RepID=UPI003416475C
MLTVYDGELRVSYRQFYVESRPEVFDGPLSDSRAGQNNGLCGAAVPGHLFLTTGLHTGRVGLTVEVHESEPTLDEAWEDIVEAPFHPASTAAVLTPWGEAPLCTVELNVVPHRVRYGASAMDLTVDQELSVLDGGSIIDRYLLQFWPAPPAPDEVIKQTSRSAAYWHTCARSV